MHLSHAPEAPAAEETSFEQFLKIDLSRKSVYDAKINYIIFLDL